MPLTESEKRRVEKAENIAAAKGSNKLLVRAPDSGQKLGPFSVACTILNRTIGRSSLSPSDRAFCLELVRCRVRHLCLASDSSQRNR